MKENMLLESRQSNINIPNLMEPSDSQTSRDTSLLLNMDKVLFKSTGTSSSSASMPPVLPSASSSAGAQISGHSTRNPLLDTHSFSSTTIGKSPDLGHRFHTLPRAHTLPYSPPSVFFRFNQDHIPSEWSFAFKKSILATSSQGTLTTDQSFKILTANDFICHSIQLSEDELIGTSLLDYISEPYRTQHLNLMQSRNEVNVGLGLKAVVSSSGEDAVLVCGSTIRLQSKYHGTYSASLWLKEQRRDNKPVIYIWVFEELEENHCNFVINSKTGQIVQVDGFVQKVFGFTPSELESKPLKLILPHLSKSDDSIDFNNIKNLKFFGAKNRRGVSFPVVIKTDQEMDVSEEITESFKRLSANNDLLQVQIVAMPHIAGAITIFDSGRIHSVNDVFAKYLCGRSAASLVGSANITDILFDFWQMFPELKNPSGVTSTSATNTQIGPVPSIRADDTLDSLSALGSPRLQSMAFSWTRMTTPASSTVHTHSSVSMFARHRDGSEFPVDVHVRPIFNGHTSDAYIFAVWITFIGNFEVQALADVLSTATGSNAPLSIIETAIVPGGQIVASPVLRKMSLPVGSKSAEFPSENERNVSATLVTPFVIPGPQAPEVPLGEDASHLDALPPSAIPIEAEATSISTELMNSIRKLSTPFNINERSSWTIEDFDIIKALGEGAYGFVRLAYHKHDLAPESHKIPYVIKYIVKNKVLSWTRRSDLGGKIPVEVAVLADLAGEPHPNIVQMTDFFEDDFFVYMVMPHKGSIDLFEYIESVGQISEGSENTGLSESVVRTIFKQIALGVKHLHDRSIVHRDIKDENVILDADLNATLVDFGSSAYLDPDHTKKFSTFYGTMDFASPEVLEGNPYEGKPQDIWALGILLYTLVYRENPFCGVDEILNLKESGLRVPFVMSEESLELIRRMLSREASDRPSIEEVLAHPWLNRS